MTVLIHYFVMATNQGCAVTPCYSAFLPADGNVLLWSTSLHNHSPTQQQQKCGKRNET